MGGSIAKLAAAGHEVTLVDLTDGEPTPHGSREIRAQEARRAAEILGATRVQLGMVNRQVVNDLASRSLVASTIRRLRPEIAFVHHPEDAHPDHVATSGIVEAARFAGRYSNCDLQGEPWRTPRLYYYYSIHLHAVPSPSFIADTTGFSKAKIDSILAYSSQFVANEANRQVPEWIAAADRYFGSRIRRESGEAFYSRESIELNFA